MQEEQNQHESNPDNDEDEFNTFMMNDNLFNDDILAEPVPKKRYRPQKLKKSSKKSKSNSKEAAQPQGNTRKKPRYSESKPKGPTEEELLDQKINGPEIRQDGSIPFPYELSKGKSTKNLIVPLVPFEDDFTKQNDQQQSPSVSMLSSSPNQHVTTGHLMSNHYSSITIKNANDRWFTPIFIIRSVVKMIDGQIDLDPTSEPAAQRIVAAKEYWTSGALEREWNGRVVFLNPPFSDVNSFVRHALEQFEAGRIGELFMLIRAAPSSSWFDMAWRLPKCHTMFFMKRLKFFESEENALVEKDNREMKRKRKKKNIKQALEEEQEKEQENDTENEKSSSVQKDSNLSKSSYVLHPQTEVKQYHVKQAYATMPHEIALMYFGDNTEGFIHEFSQYGRIIRPINTPRIQIPQQATRDRSYLNLQDNIQSIDNIF
ncbi:MAG: hypothetical protein EZS28_018654 [Streblomastix strix]|uniref:Uncharacterized protein n=1 Tax=Streblomastix strix TaxID=222440 RepID=A0A5J4VTQ9_9EUKA|nr:MAG: hypothetical protein EZS28_018654 [Streblomastix strix]